MNIMPRIQRNFRSLMGSGSTKRYLSTPSATPSDPPPTEKPLLFKSNVKYPLTKTKKIMCVWAKRYPSLKDVPDHVNPEVWSKVRSIVRIKMANYTMALMLLGCVMVIVSGKRARDRGESLSQRNLEWHQNYTEGKEEKNISILGK